MNTLRHRHSMHYAVVLAAVLFALGAVAQPPAALASDNADDLLKGLDSALAAPPPAATQEPARPRLECIENFHGKLELSSAYYWAGAEHQDWLGVGRLKLSTSQPVAGWNVAANAWIEAGNQDDTWAGVNEWPQDDDRRRRYLEINELYATRSAGPYDLTFGRKLLPNGVSTLWSPADRYDAWDLNDPVDNRRMGTWQARVDRYFGDTTLTAVLLPVYQDHKVPSPQSRWYGNAFDYDFRYEAMRPAQQFPNLGAALALVPEKLVAWMNARGLSIDLLQIDPETAQLRRTRTVPAVTWRNLGTLLRAKTTYSGFDLYSSFSYSYSPYPVLRVSSSSSQDVLAAARLRLNVTPLNASIAAGFSTSLTATRLELETAPVRYASAAAGFSTTHGRWEFHGEAVQNQAEAGRDDSYLNYAVGTIVSIDELAHALGCQGLNLVAEYFGEWETRSQNAVGYILSSREMRIGQRDIAAAAELKVNEDWSLRAAGHFELRREGRFYRLDVRKRLAAALFLTCRAEVFSGPKESYYGLWRDNDRAIVALEYSF
jgi:hypothetical protein